ncbi:MAG: 50S ribosomal protein L11 methyltransferase [Nitrospirales bacterium]|nr:MAG: 50S ribosomal protein L11 methyltransferase [Nitrospirales bacterium]
MRTIDTPVTSSFRDPSGFLFFREGVLYRQVNRVYQDHYDQFIQSGLYDFLVNDSLLISHQDVSDEFSCNADVYKILKPEPISFISYPYEWCFSQLKHAALLTLKIQRRAFEHGMMLKDASAYNIQYRKGLPILIDSLSFESYRIGQPWFAYRQFCQHFLAPLVLMSYRDIRLNQLMQINLDGIPLDLTSSLLPWSSRIRFGVLSHIHLHAKSQKRFASANISNYSRPVTCNAVLGLIDSLESTIHQLHYKEEGSCWSSYYDEHSYSENDMTEKIVMVGQVLDELKPKTMWDLGANTGRFSQLASEKGIYTLSFEGDPLSSEHHYQACVQRGETMVLPLILDLSNPSSGIGWAHEERQSLLERGPADVILALALIHHLAIANNVPFEKIAEFLSRLCETLIIEFVPKEDSQVRRLLSSRTDIFHDYTQSQFEESFQRFFHIEESMLIGHSQRLLYVMRRS